MATARQGQEEGGTGGEVGGKPGVWGIQSSNEMPEAGGGHHPQAPQAGSISLAYPLPDSWGLSLPSSSSLPTGRYIPRAIPHANEGLHSDGIQRKLILGEEFVQVILFSGWSLALGAFWIWVWGPEKEAAGLIYISLWSLAPLWGGCWMSAEGK